MFFYLLFVMLLSMPGSVTWATPEESPPETIVIEVHHSKVKKTRMVVPQYPEAAKAKFADADSYQYCKVRMYIDRQGVPFAVKFESCDPVFHENTNKALMKWRFVAVDNEKNKPLKGVFLLKIHFRMRSPASP